MTDVNGRRPGVADSADTRGKAVRFAWQRDAVEEAMEEPRRSAPPRPRVPRPLSDDRPTTANPSRPYVPVNGSTRPAPPTPSAADTVTPPSDERDDVARQRRERNERAFAVPPPGGRLSHGRGGHLTVRVAIAMTACLLLLGCAFIFGMLANRVGRSDANRSVSADQLAKYHVQQFPLQSAAAVAERFTRLCLNASPATAADRSRQLRAIVSGDVGSSCGWNGRGRIRATDIVWTGQADPMPQQGDHGRYLHMQAALGPDGDLIQFVVPIYVADTVDGTGVRVSGAPGILPGGAAPSPADAISADQSRDTGLAQRLMTNVLPGFFTAWGRSSAADLDRYRTPDATTNVRSGMARILTDPVVQDAVVPLPDEGLGSTHTWQSGDRATVLATVRWDLPGSAQVTLGYRLTMVRNTTTASGWSIRDIAGGLPDSSLSSDLQNGTMPASYSLPHQGGSFVIATDNRYRARAVRPISAQ